MEITKTQQNIMESKSFLSIIAAISREKRALGKGGGLLWSIPADLKHFKQVTSGHPVIMGRKTWESLPPKFRPLPGRLNIIVTRNESFEATGAVVVKSIEEALEEGGKNNEIFIIGGGEIYKQALPYANRLYLTIVEEEKEADTFFPDYSEFKNEISRECFPENNPPFCFVVLKK